MEQWEHYVKQSYRNRSRILSSNGPLDLIVPVEKSQGCKTLLKDVRLAYHDRWNAEHWNAIRSAYNSSPYFEYYVDDIERFFTQQFDFLIDYNTELLDCILNLLKIPHTITYSENFVPLHTENQDFRYAISPKVTTPDVHFPELHIAIHSFFRNLFLLFCSTFYIAIFVPNPLFFYNFGTAHKKTHPISTL